MQSQLNHHTVFTLDQILAANSHVRSGADFPAFIQAIIKLGVQRYSTYITDGHTDYEGDGRQVIKPAQYELKAIAPKGDAAELSRSLKVHQGGGTDFPTFCKEARAAGVEKWTVDTNAMTCTYFDAEGNKLVEERISVP